MAVSRLGLGARHAREPRKRIIRADLTGRFEQSCFKCHTDEPHALLELDLRPTRSADGHRLACPVADVEADLVAVRDTTTADAAADAANQAVRAAAIGGSQLHDY